MPNPHPPSFNSDELRRLTEKLKLSENNNEKDKQIGHQIIQPDKNNKIEWSENARVSPFRWSDPSFISDELRRAPATLEEAQASLI